MLFAGNEKYDHEQIKLNVDDVPQKHAGVKNKVGYPAVI